MTNNENLLQKYHFLQHILPFKLPPFLEEILFSFLVDKILASLIEKRKYKEKVRYRVLVLRTAIICSNINH